MAETSPESEHYRRALQRLPLKRHLNFRFWGEDRTIYERARGPVTDLDGNVYVGTGWAMTGDPRLRRSARG
jgi:glutamate-1-semialdehyde 2,1-aminomutase